MEGNLAQKLDEYPTFVGSCTDHRAASQMHQKRLKKLADQGRKTTNAVAIAFLIGTFIIVLMLSYLKQGILMTSGLSALDVHVMYQTNLMRFFMSAALWIILFLNTNQKGKQGILIAYNVFMFVGNVLLTVVI